MIARTSCAGGHGYGLDAGVSGASYWVTGAPWGEGGRLRTNRGDCYLYPRRKGGVDACIAVVFNSVKQFLLLKTP